jgi:plasmid stabilization system protein ParE
MPRDSKAKYTDKQKRKARHIEESYQQRGVGEEEAARRAWATVNEQDGGGREGGRLAGKSRTGSGRARETTGRGRARKTARRGR